MKCRYSNRSTECITVSDLCPTVAITYRLGRTHIATSDADVEAMVRENVARQRTRKENGWTAEAEEEAVRFALWRHAENQAEYGWVMGGHYYA